MHERFPKNVPPDLFQGQPAHAKSFASRTACDVGRQEYIWQRMKQRIGRCRLDIGDIEGRKQIRSPLQNFNHFGLGDNSSSRRVYKRRAGSHAFKVVPP